MLCCGNGVVGAVGGRANKAAVIIRHFSLTFLARFGLQMVLIWLKERPFVNVNEYIEYVA